MLHLPGKVSPNRAFRRWNLPRDPESLQLGPAGTGDPHPSNLSLLLALGFGALPCVVDWALLKCELNLTFSPYKAVTLVFFTAMEKHLLCVLCTARGPEIIYYFLLF